MKLNKILASMAGVSLMALASCTSETYELAVPEFTPADLTEGVAYTVNVDQSTNTVTMTSLMPSKYQLSWIHPNGQSRDASVEIQLPFSGDYELKFGVQTKGGLVYGEPYTFTIENTNGDLLTDKVWIDLTGGADNSKTWTWDVNNLSGFTCLTFADGYDWNYYMNGIDPGSDNGEWAWAAGFQDWLYGKTNGEALTPADFPDITFDLINGSHVTNELTGASGAFNYNPVTHQMTIPTGFGIIGSYCPESFVESSSVFDVVAINEHVFGFKLRRNDDPCDLVFIYVEKGWDGSWATEGAPEVSAPEDPFKGDMDDLTTSTSNTKTWILNEVSPYDWYWWDGTTSQWTNNDLKIGVSYGQSWCPEPSESWLENFSLQLTKGGESNTFVLNTPLGNTFGSYTVSGNALQFDQTVTFFNVAGSNFNVNITTDKLYVVSMDAENNKLTLGVPTKVNGNGVVTEYLALNLDQQLSGGGESGPTIIIVDNSKLNCYVEAEDHYRLELYNPYVSGDYCIDASQVRVKPGKQITIDFTISGITWNEGAEPRIIFGNNFEAFGFIWPSDGSGFDQEHTVFDVATGNGKAILKNTSESTIVFEGSSAITICVEIRNLVAAPLTEGGILDATQVTSTVNSFMIE